MLHHRLLTNSRYASGIIAWSLFRTHPNIYDGAFLQKLFIFCGGHNYMIPNNKKLMFLALVLALQWNSHPHLVYVHST